MTIALTDLANAVGNYLDTEVTLDITKVTTNVEPFESGSFTITATNAAAPDGVKLTDLAFHITVTDPTIIDILGLDDAAGLKTSRENANPNSAVVVNGTVAPNGEMCVFFNDDNGVLDVGASKPAEVQYTGKAVGTATIRCHVHATVAADDLFPPDTRGVKFSHHDVTIIK
jgi:hypothetical protein